MGYQIAIDGPSGSGKSTLAKNLAKRLNIKYVDTGAMYRAVGFYMLKNSVDLSSPEKIEENISNVYLKAEYIDEKFRILLNGDDITDELRTQEVSDAASRVAVVPKVREVLLDLQREVANKYDVVMEGRDIGSRVLANADLKIFLDAGVDIRTLRRIEELNITCDYETIKSEIEERDSRDCSRKTDPLVKAEDAFYIDGSNMTEEELVQAVVRLKAGERM